ncbi:hypothetical protein F4821DRAFT_243687 [Hypoxylon rubiginosum]|uniref:Uncharacterized protein n=1 Tax=Hypoxylon rubiginosum TaxID=110542 RepID=A0ACC0CV98_9PEZI|nr:hypothetical protein F4821DRAFT_243687 [Hypoxylon rubiginosum]
MRAIFLLNLGLALFSIPIASSRHTISTDREGGDAEDHAATSEGCIVSRMSRWDMARTGKEISFSTNPLDNFEAPRVELLNSTTGEQWEFDGISEDGRQAVMIGFYRDPSFAFLGTGNLRFYLEFSFPNGSRYSIVDYAEESIIDICTGRGTRGTWTGAGRTYTFEVSDSMSNAKVTMNSPEVSGTITLESIAPPRYADNSIWPSPNASTMPIPYFHWVEPIPAANSKLDIILNGKPVSWSGIGGHERLWGAFNWYTCVHAMTAIRFRAGSYAVSLVEFNSNIYKNLTVSSVILVQGGDVVFKTRRVQSSETEDYMELFKIYSSKGVTTSALSDKVTGLELILRSPGRDLTWKFSLRHLNIGFEHRFSQGMGSTGYSGVANGGLVGTGQNYGPAFSEVMMFPKKSLLFTQNYIG